MKSQAALLGVKQAPLSPESELWRHAAVRPLVDHEAPLAEHQVPRSDVCDFSRVPVHASGSDGGHIEVSCPLSPRHCPFGGACHTCPTHVQAKLAFNQPGDEYEQEADRVAEQVTRAPGTQLQRCCTSQEELTHVPSIVHEALRSSNQPLDSHTQAFMESRMEYDFSRVRVHTDALASDSARSLHASAYTVGNDIVFASGAYAPSTSHGRHLLGHELTHVIQQGRNGKRIQRWNDDTHKQLTQEASDELADGDVAPVAAGKEQFIAELKPYSYSTDWKARRILWTYPLFRSGAVQGEGPDHGEDGNYQSTDKRAAIAQNKDQQDKYTDESIAFYRQLISAPRAQQARGGPQAWREDAWHAMAAPVLGTFTGAIAGAMYGAALVKLLSEKISGVGRAMLGGLVGLAAIPIGFAVGALAGALGIGGGISVGKSRPATNAREAVLAALGDACHVAQDRAAHWEGVKGYGHSKPGFEPDNPAKNPGGESDGLAGGRSVAVKNTKEVFKIWKQDVDGARRSSGVGPRQSIVR